MDTVTLSKIPYLINPTKDRRIEKVVYLPGMTVGEVTARSRRELLDLGFHKFAITRNGHLVENLGERVVPGDVVGISVHHGFFAAAGFLIAAAGITGTAATIATAVLGTVFMVTAGLIVTALMAPGTPEPAKQDSPTYRWDGYQNNLREGAPVPVVYGECASAPSVIGSYRTIDNDYNMWQYLLLAISAGKTNNVPTEDDIYIGDEPLKYYSDYSLGTTSGDLTITAGDRAEMEDFDKIRHDRLFDKILKSNDRANPVAVTLLHFNVLEWAEGDYLVGQFIAPTTPNGYVYECTTSGTSGGTEPSWPTTPGNTVNDGTVVWTCRTGSTSVINSSTRTNTWTCNGGCSIKTTTPKFGNGYLNFTTANDNLSTDDYESFRLPQVWEIEFWINLPDLSDRGIMGQQAVKDIAGGEVKLYRWGLFYKSGKLLLQAYTGTYPEGGAAGDIKWNLTADISGDWTPDANTWYFVRIQRVKSFTTDDTPNLTDSVNLKNIYMMAGKTDPISLIASGNGEMEWFEVDETVTPYDDFTMTQKSISQQQIGKAYWLNPAYVWPESEAVSEAVAITPYDGLCKLDEIRISRGRANVAEYKSLPTGEFNEPVADAQTFILTTRSKCDSVKILIELPQGLYKMDEEDGSLHSYTVQFYLSYKTSVGTVWTSSTVSISDKHTSAVRKEFEIAFPVRAKYDVAIERITPDDEDNGMTRSQSVLIGFIEVINIRQMYPGIQLASVGIKSSDRASGQVGAVQVINKRTSIVVPNFNGSGTQTVNPQNNAWAVYDGMTNLIYGRKLDPTTFVQSAWEDWVDYCNGMVGGNYRCRCNMVIDQVGNMSENLLSPIEQAGRAIVDRLGDKWTVIIDKPRTPVYLFSSGNVLPGSVVWESIEYPELIDAVDVRYWDKDKRYQPKTIRKKTSWFESLTRQPKIASFEMRAINTRDEAERYAIIQVRKASYLTRTGSLKCGLEAALVERGDVFYLVHSRNRQSWSGRTSRDHSGSSYIHLDQLVTLTPPSSALSTKIYLIDPDGTIREHSVVGPWDEATQVIEIDGTYTGSRFDTYGIGFPTQDKLLYQVLSKSITETDSGVEVEIQFIEYDDRVYYHPDYEGGLVPI